MATIAGLFLSIVGKNIAFSLYGVSSWTENISFSVYIYIYIYIYYVHVCIFTLYLYIFGGRFASLFIFLAMEFS